MKHSPNSSFPARIRWGSSTREGRIAFRFVAVAADAPYRNIREPILPGAYVPFHTLSEVGALQPSREQTFLVRTVSSNPLVLAGLLRREVSAFQPAFRVSNIPTQQ